MNVSFFFCPSRQVPRVREDITVASAEGSEGADLASGWMAGQTEQLELERLVVHADPSMAQSCNERRDVIHLDSPTPTSS